MLWTTWPRKKMAVRSFKDLIVWERSIELVVESYAVTKRLPREERYALTQQLRRAAVSVASNIAEGHSRARKGEYLYHLSVARGSLAELRTQLEVAVRLDYLRLQDVARASDLAAEVSRMLAALRAKLKVRSSSLTPDP